MKPISFFTTSNKLYFQKNGKQFVDSFRKFSGCDLVVYSEDLDELISAKFHIRRIKHWDLIKKFQDEFRNKMSSRYAFLPYHSKMDIWAIKIAIQLQFLEAQSEGAGVYIDSDSVIFSEKFDEVIDGFISPVKSYDLGIFRRVNSHLHPESGFLVLNASSESLKATYQNMLDRILSHQFYNLPSLTDCSLLDDEIISKSINAIDFCDYYQLKSTNPVYESDLRKVMLHLKGPRKGSYSSIKKILGFYR
jgi:hypothetical protein